MVIRDGFILACLFLLQVVIWLGVKPIPLADDGVARQKPTTIWQGTYYVRPNLGTIPPVPSATEVKAFSFGDPQWYFRIAAFRLQNAGDTFGRTTPLSHYNYEDLYSWWMTLDTIDPKAIFAPAIASYYYGATQKPKEQVPYIIRYLENHADKDPAANWWWYNQAAYLARHRIEDKEWALRISDKLHNIPPEADVPIWAREMSAFILEDKGEYAAACEMVLRVMDDAKEHGKEISDYELNFIYHFVNQRIAKFIPKDAENVDPRCLALNVLQTKNTWGKEQVAPEPQE